MDTLRNFITGILVGKKNIYFWFLREFIFLMKKILIILTISLVKIGDPPLSYQNNAFFILILNSLFFGIELKLKPFGISQLNSLNLISNLVTIATIFGGLFSSINQQTSLSFTLMIVIIGLNIYFLLVFLKSFIMINLTFIEKINFFSKILNKIYKKFWPSGEIIFVFKILPLKNCRKSNFATINHDIL